MLLGARIIASFVKVLRMSPIVVLSFPFQGHLLNGNQEAAPHLHAHKEPTIINCAIPNYLLLLFYCNKDRKGPNS
jgi:hypothetical protein